MRVPVAVVDDIAARDRAMRFNPDRACPVTIFAISTLDLSMPVADAGRADWLGQRRSLTAHVFSNVEAGTDIAPALLPRAVRTAPRRIVLYASQRSTNLLTRLWRMANRTWITAAAAARSGLATASTNEANHRFIIAPAWL